MRDAFFNELYKLAKKNRNIILLSDDFGAPSIDKFRENLNKQYFNVGIAEQSMVSIAAGLALSRKIVYLYAIAPFVTLRCYEQMKIDISSMNLTVNAIGVGAGYAYETAGPTHHATEDIAVMRVLPNFTIYNSSDAVMAAKLAKISYMEKGPKYIRFDRGKTPIINSEKNDFSTGLTVIKESSDYWIIATGTMVYRAIEVADELAKRSLDIGVIDLYRLKPVNKKLLVKIIKSAKGIITLEEHNINGGLGSIVAEVLSDEKILIPIKRIGIEDEKCYNYGNRKYLQTICGLDARNVTKKIVKWVR
jgi:transketolase